MPIRLLAPDVADKIAAGEVVERPASVAKELIENSLDAGATDIRVEVREGGRGLVRVIDNGSGIPAAEAALAVQRHATSKLQNADDLEHIATLGFRGEALAAISAVSQFTLVTRAASEVAGVELRLEGGRVAGQRPIGSPPGTSISVERLFWNTPARLKFLRSDATESGHISRIVTRYALVYPHVRFSYLAEGKLVFQSPGNGDPAQVLIKVFDAAIARHMLAIRPDDDPAAPGIQVGGFVSEPGLHRANRSAIEIFVNRRAIQDRNLTFAVIQAYHTLLPGDRFPLALVFVSLPPEQVDVNVHPAKAEVRFRDASLIFRAVQRAVHRTLVDAAPIASLTPAAQPGWAQRRDALLQAGQPDTPRGQMAMDLYRHSLAPDDAPILASQEDAPLVAPPVAPAPSAAPSAALPPLRPVGQVAAAWLVAEGPGGLFLIDQHAAHERILYEQIVEAERRPVPRQQLLEPLPIELGGQLAGLIADHLPTLQQSGFEIEPFGAGSYLLRAIPAFMGRQDPQRLLAEVAENLGQHDDLVGQGREDELVKIICKRLAIKAGQVLSLAEQRELLRQLEACANPRTCPHGRPTVLHFSAAQLEKQFGRI
jgi:DNA mismatch repair protein MutL